MVVASQHPLTSPPTPITGWGGDIHQYRRGGWGLPGPSAPHLAFCLLRLPPACRGGKARWWVVLAKIPEDGKRLGTLPSQAIQEGPW